MALFYRRLPRFEYLSPKTLNEALSILDKYKGEARLLAGGTDLIPQIKRRETAIPQYVVDLKGIADLNFLSCDEESELRIGALATISSIADSPVVRTKFPVLAQAALTMASPQVRNRGTFTGNICNAVPSADSVPALLSMGALVSIKGLGGDRTVPLDQFFSGLRKTILQPDEMVIAISVPQPMPGMRGVYLKLSPRHSMDLAVVGVAAAGVTEAGICREIKIALGAVAPTPIRAYAAEEVLKGKKITPEAINDAAKVAVTLCSPREDSHRASPEYRRDMVQVMTRRALKQILGGGE